VHHARDSLVSAPARPAVSPAPADASLRPAAVSLSPAARARAVGRRGEQQAAAWYEANGFEVLATGWRCASGEIDVVCRRGGLVVVCEVKARTSSRFGAPEEAVGPAKQRRLRRLAACYLAEAALRTTRVRFDVATVLDGRLQLIEDAF